MNLEVQRSASKAAAGSEARHVLVALQGSEAPVSAIAMGREIATALHVPLKGVLVWPRRIAPSDISRLLHLEERTLEGMVLDVEVGNPADRLGAVSRSSGVAFVVLSAEMEGGDVCGLGNVAARTIERTDACVVLVRPNMTPRPLRRILVPLDGAPSTAMALEPASELARRAGAALDVVLIDDAAARPSTEPGSMVLPRYIDQPQHEWPAFSEEFLQRFVGAIARCPPGVPTRFFLGTGPRAAEILRFSQALDSDLIALVWHGDCADKHGTVFREVIRRTTRPVLVLRGERLALQEAA